MVPLHGHDSKSPRRPKQVITNFQENMTQKFLNQYGHVILFLKGLKQRLREYET